MSLSSWLLAPALLSSAPMTADPSAESAFSRAMDRFESMHFAQAFEALAPLADAGHADAARIALLMRAHGPRLFGQRFEVDAQRRERWLDAASRAYVHLQTAVGEGPR
jgi:hypothetical protein